MKIENQIAQAVMAALKALYGIEAAPETLGIQKTKKEFEGNLTLVVFPFLKASRKAPEATATEIGEYLTGHNPELIAAFNVVKGFLNLVVSPSCWVGQLNAIATTPHYGIREASADSPLVMMRIFFAQYQQTFAFGACAQQPAGVQSRLHHGCQR